MISPTIANFNDLTNAEKRDTIIAIIEAAADMWGDQCMPRIGLGDSAVYDMNDIADWVVTVL